MHHPSESRRRRPRLQVEGRKFHHLWWTSQAYRSAHEHAATCWVLCMSSACSLLDLSPPLWSIPYHPSEFVDLQRTMMGTSRAPQCCSWTALHHSSWLWAWSLPGIRVHLPHHLAEGTPQDPTAPGVQCKKPAAAAAAHREGINKSQTALE